MSHRSWTRLGAVAMAACLLTPLAGCSGHDSDEGHHGEGHRAGAGRPGEDLTRKSKGWASAASATLTPGVQTYTDGSGQCTTNFVFTDNEGAVFLGQAAHCASTGEAAGTNGCKTNSLPLGTRVLFKQGGSLLDEGETIGSGTLVYSSWITMHRLDETDENTCAYNDFALIKVDQPYVDDVNPSVPFWGGPVGLNQQGLAPGEEVHSYGNSSIRAGISDLSPQTGTADGDAARTDGWSHALHAPTPGIPGDSGSAYLDSQGRAVGILSTLGLALPIVNNIGDLTHELEYARGHSRIKGLALELGTEPFSGRT